MNRLSLVSKKTALYALCGVLCLLSVSCGDKRTKVEQMRRISAPEALIWPDYVDCTIPVNIAPLNFYVLPEHSSYRITVAGTDGNGNGGSLTVKGRYRVRFNPKKWRALLEANQGRELKVEVELKTPQGRINREFLWKVEGRIDPYLTYRLIEPCYQTSFRLHTMEYNLEEASQRVLVDNETHYGSCHNCHTYPQSDGDYLVYHVRFTFTGTYICLPDREIRVNTKSDRFTMGGVYPSWHPDKNLIAFGTSSAIPIIHSGDLKRRSEVYDSLGDIIVYDIARNYIFTDERLCNTATEETSPFFSWDGKWLYFCQADCPPRDSVLENDADMVKRIKYRLMRIAFNDSSNRFGELEMLIDGPAADRTVSMPRLSPDDRYVCFSLSDHGTFPIRHPESDLYLMDLQGEVAEGDTVNGFYRREGFACPVKEMEHVNSPFSESFHEFSSTGGWMVFSSKREDNFYARPYFIYVSPEGVSGKPFMMPQKDPAVYFSMTRSFNVPEFSSKPVNLNIKKTVRMKELPEIKPDSTVIRNGSETVIKEGGSSVDAFSGASQNPLASQER